MVGQQQRRTKTKISNRREVGNRARRGEGIDSYVAPETNDEEVEHIPRISNVGRAAGKYKAKRNDLDNAFEQENAHQHIVTVFKIVHHGLIVDILGLGDEEKAIQLQVARSISEINKANAKYENEHNIAKRSFVWYMRKSHIQAGAHWMRT